MTLVVPYPDGIHLSHAPGTRRPWSGPSRRRRHGHGHGATPRLGLVALCEERDPHPDARRDAALHRGLSTAGHVAALRDHAHAHAIQRRPVWPNRVSAVARTIARLHERRI